jgi:hypothetical protein
VIEFDYLIVVDERPIGMIETYVVSDHPEWEAIVRSARVSRESIC